MGRREDDIETTLIIIEVKPSNLPITNTLHTVACSCDNVHEDGRTNTTHGGKAEFRQRVTESICIDQWFDTRRRLDLFISVPRKADVAQWIQYSFSLHGSVSRGRLLDWWVHIFPHSCITTYHTSPHPSYSVSRPINDASKM